MRSEGEQGLVWQQNRELEIGSVPKEKYDRFKELLAAAPINNDE
jgi:hypothetical protein